MYFAHLATAVFLFMGVMAAQSGTARPAGSKLYYLKDGARQEWCGYAKQSEWAGEVQARNAWIMAIVTLETGRVSEVHITETDETGDWAVNDDYFLDRSEAIRSAKRKINILPGDTSEEQVFLVQSGVMIKQRSTVREISTGKLVKDPHPGTWLNVPPLVTKSKGFPFWALVTGRKELLSKGRSCVPAPAK